MRVLAIGMFILALAPTGAAFGQYAPVDPMPSGQTSTSVMANKLSGEIAGGNAGANSVSSRCFANSGPGAERRAMEAEHALRRKTYGKASADAWVEAQGRKYRAGLRAAGKCK